VPMGPQWVGPLAQFFGELVRADDERWFHPHPLTRGYAQELGSYAGRDVYVLMVEGRKVLGYGMLRGWDEGFEVPSLGIAISPAHKGRGLGRKLMAYLHEAAVARGAATIRLTVDESNLAAVRLYTSLGYTLIPDESGRLVGTRPA
jgi:[ribosomal protein S18]-alanine N-acetyltransferase